MKDKDLYQGFAPEKQTEYEEYIRNKFGVDNEAWLESQKHVKKFTKAEWEKNGKEEGVRGARSEAPEARRFMADAMRVFAERELE